MAIYKMKFMFDWGSGVCLWSANKAAENLYDYPVETRDLPISDDLKALLESLIGKHDEALNWQEPQGKLLWTEDQQAAFLKRHLKHTKELFLNSDQIMTLNSLHRTLSDSRGGIS